MIIDSHTHIFPPEMIESRHVYLPRDHWFNLLYGGPKPRMATAEQLIASMDEAEVDASVAFGFSWKDMSLCRVGNDYVLEAAASHPERILPFAVVNPASGHEALAEAERCLREGAIGVGELIADGQGFSLSDETMTPLMEWATEHNLPILLHVAEPVGHHYHGKGGTGPDAVYHLVERFPEATLILAHWGGGLPFYELMPEVRRAFSHVYYDTAASPHLYDSAIFQILAPLVGDKILLGTDFPLIGQKQFLAHVRRVSMSSRNLTKILGDNAVRLLGLEI